MVEPSDRLRAVRACGRVRAVELSLHDTRCRAAGRCEVADAATGGDANPGGPVRPAGREWVRTLGRGPAGGDRPAGDGQGALGAAAGREARRAGEHPATAAPDPTRRPGESPARIGPEAGGDRV